MKKVLLFIVSSVMCMNALIPTVTAEESLYTVYSDYEVTESTHFADDLGLMTGYEDGSFRPDNPVTRAEFIASVMRAAAIAYPDIEGDGVSFYDVDESHWAYEYIEKAVSMGFVSGYEDGTFRPEDNITYEQAAAMIFKMLGYAPVLDMYGGFPNAYMAWAYYDGLFKKADGNRNGEIEMDTNKQTTPITRGDAMLMLDWSLFIPICYVTDYRQTPEGLEAVYNLGGTDDLKKTLYAIKYVTVEYLPD
ncbi:MAG: S-layer homology domain-containing protein [Oscillospiraceae bacterium]|nr:S-layer homology domain-containing protein [Oscillospiraceae bacterium]